MTAISSSPTASGLAPWAAAFVMVSAAVPWLNPLSAGPVPSALQYLLSYCFLGALVLIFAVDQGRWGRTAWARCLAWAWLAAALVSSGIAVLQYFGWTDALRPWVNGAQVGQAYGNLRQRNQFASLVSMGLVACLFVAPRGAWRWAAIALLAIGNACSSSRTGALQWLALSAVYALWSAPGAAGRRELVGALAMYVLAMLVLPWLLGVWLGMDGSSALTRLEESSGCVSRTVLWSNVLTLIAEKPWWGWGWGGLKYAHFSYPYPGDRFCDILDNAHNLPLQLAVELGVPAAVLVLGGIAVWVVRQRPWAETQPVRQFAWAVLLVIALHSMVEYPLWYAPFQIAALAACALLWVPRSPHPVVLRAVGIFAAGVALGVWALVAWVGYDYARVTQLYMPEKARWLALRDNTLAKVRDSVWFQNEVRFAEITTTATTPANAPLLYALAKSLLRYSPEPRTLNVLLESGELLGKDVQALALWRLRYATVYPQDYALFLRTQVLSHGTIDQ